MSKALAVKQDGIVVTFNEMREMAKSLAASKMFGLESEDQALSLMMLCQAEGLHPVMALRRYHIIEGKPAYRADALQGEFERAGAILWHERNEKLCAATFFRDKHKVDAEAITRAKERYKAISKGQTEGHLAELGELTIIRTIEDAVEKKVAMSWNKERKEYVMKKNWRQSPRQMLHARCLTEGVRAINPGLVAGVYTEDEIYDMDRAEELPLYDGSTGKIIAERNVRQATANAIEENGGIVIEGKPARDTVTDENGKVTGSEILHQTPDVFEQPAEITADNYGELVVHFGKPQGEMLGRKVKELHPNVISWLYNKWINKLGPSASDSDMRLKGAIEFAHRAGDDAPRKAVESSEATATAQDSPAEPTAPTAAPEKGKVVKKGKVVIVTGVEGFTGEFHRVEDWRETVIDAPAKSNLQGKKLGEFSEGLLAKLQTGLIEKCDWSNATVEQKKFLAAYGLAKGELGLLLSAIELREELRDRAQDLILTEEQLCKVLREQGVLDKETSLDQVSEQLLRYLYNPANWKVVKQVVEDASKPKVEPTPKKKRGRK
jgi:hypothetical protein